MEGSKTKKLSVWVSEKLIAKIKANAAYSNVTMTTFVNRALIEKIKKIEKGEDKFIKIVGKE